MSGNTHTRQTPQSTWTTIDRVATGADWLAFAGTLTALFVMHS